MQWAFRWVHPDLGIPLADFLSKDSRAKGGKEDATFQAPENEWLWSYSKDILNTQDIDCFIFGHRHLPLDLEVPRPAGASSADRRGTSTWATGSSISPAGKLLRNRVPASPLIPFASPAQKIPSLAARDSSIRFWLN